VRAAFKVRLNLTSPWQPICNMGRESVRTKISRVQDHCLV